MISTRNLSRSYIPSSEEVEWSQSVARGKPLQHASPVAHEMPPTVTLLPEPREIPKEIQRHIAAVIDLEHIGF